MKLTAELMLVPYAAAEATSAERLARLARATERAGFDAIGFNEHPAPAKRWLDSGGHEAFDPFAALAFCAAVTTRLRLMPFLAVLPYRHPLMLAKSIATVDKLSDGRLVVCAGTGYLRGEFTARVDFEDRNERFDDAITTLESLWTDDWSGSPQSRPLPVQLPHPPIWIGGNSALTRRRVAQSGQGWTPMLADDALAKLARTATIGSVDRLASAIAELRRLVVDNGRDPDGIEIQVNGALHSQAGAEELSSDRYLDVLASLAAIGVTQSVVHLELDAGQRTEETIEAFGANIIPQLPL